MSDLMTSQSATGFATLVDLARLRFGATSAEICDVCNTINIGSLRFCKGCSHKLPAFYANGGDGAEAVPLPKAPPRAWHPSAMDFAAFVVALFLLWITEFMPFA